MRIPLLGTTTSALVSPSGAVAPVMLLLSVPVGICSGLAACGLNAALSAVAAALEPVRDGFMPAAIALPALGAFLAVIFLRAIVRDRAGHGVPEVIYSISHRGGAMPLRTCFSRLIACLLTIASGGSAGPEAPIVISGSSIGSNIAAFFKLPERQSIVLVGCGAAGAIAAIFNAPVAGIVFTLEIIIGEWAAGNLIPIAVSSVVATETSRLFNGNQIPFQSPDFSAGLPDLFFICVLAVFTALCAVLFVRLLRWISALAQRLLPVFWQRALCGGLAVGLIGVLFPVVYGEGYVSVQAIISQTYSGTLALVGCALLAKMIATACTIGTGGTGGVFAPLLLTGSLAGLFFHQALQALLPAFTPAPSGLYALLGMAGLLSSVLHAPLTAVFLIVEITGSYQVLVPVVLIAVASVSISSLFEKFSVYHHDLEQSGQLLRPRTDQQILADIAAAELIERDCSAVAPEMTLREFIPVVQQSRRNFFAVVDSATGDFLGLVNLTAIRPFIFDTHLYDSVLIEEIMEPAPVSIEPHERLAAIMEIFDVTGAWSLPVVEQGRFLGLISKATLLDHYRKELLVQQHG